MKKILLVTFALMLLATWSFAAFAPTALELSVKEEIIYPFDGTDVDFTVDVSGQNARCWLFINTKLAEDKLPSQVNNGFLGWHYVNKIDTTVYVSGAYTFVIGTGHTITWDGKGNENTSGGYGGTYEASDDVAPGTYDYYVWAYDDQSPRVPVCKFLLPRCSGVINAGCSTTCTRVMVMNQRKVMIHMDHLGGLRLNFQ